MAPPKDTVPAAPKAPGPGVVEALANPLAAGFTAAALEEATGALRDRYTGDGATLAPVQRQTLAALACLGAQLVTATTVPAGGAS
jgi:hypothetical protein